MIKENNDYIGKINLLKRKFLLTRSADGTFYILDGTRLHFSRCNTQKYNFFFSLVLNSFVFF